MRDYDALNQEYLSMQAKFNSLASEYHNNKSGLASHHEHQSNVAYYMKKSHDESEAVKNNLEHQQSTFSVDAVGAKKSGDTKMRMLQMLKQQLHKKIDIIHMLNGEIQEKGDALNQVKLRVGQLRLEHTVLVKTTAEKEQELATARNDYAMARNDYEGLQGRIQDSKDDLAKWTVEERMMEQEVEDNEKKIKELRDQIEK